MPSYAVAIPLFQTDSDLAALQ